MVDMAEELVNLLIVLLSDRTLLLTAEQEPNVDQAVAKQEIIQALCFKPLTFSELNSKLTEQTSELEGFQAVLEELTIYRPPEGMSDSGTLRLKEQHLLQVDPYSVYYSKSQREEAEAICRAHLAKSTNRPVETVAYRPPVQQIVGGIFSTLGGFTRTHTFYRLTSRLLYFLTKHQQIIAGEVPVSRLEGLLNALLQLFSLANDDQQPRQGQDFADAAFNERIPKPLDALSGDYSLIEQLLNLLHTMGDQYGACRAKILRLLAEIAAKRPTQFQETLNRMDPDGSWSAVVASSDEKQKEDLAIKKKQALDRQAKVLASFKQQQNDFLQNQDIDWGMDDDDNVGDNDFNMADVKEPMTWNYPGGTCIFCQEDVKESDLYGTLAFITETNVFRITDVESPEQIHDVLSESSGGMSTKETAGSEEGFPTTQHQSGPVVTGCGHIMHLSCFQAYDAATTRRHSHQITRNHAESISKCEFVCPLCKALGNAFLPVVWKPKKCESLPIRDDAGFGSFCEEILSTLANPAILEIDGPGLLSRYAESAYTPGLWSSVRDALGGPTRSSAVTTSLATSTISRWRLAPLSASSSTSTLTPAGASSGSRSSGDSMYILLKKAYQRLLMSLSVNDLLKQKIIDQSTAAGLPGVGTMIKALACSIVSSEIAQRGTGNDVNYISNMSEPVIVNLRVWSETVSSYIAMAVASQQSDGHAEVEILLGKLAEKFLGSSTMSTFSSIMCNDIFEFLVECTMCAVPLLELGFYNVMRLCYLAEIVKVVLASVHNLHKIAKDVTLANGESQSPTNAEQFSNFVQHIIAISTTNPNQEWLWNPNERDHLDRIIRSLVSSYALQFLRRAALLTHISYGVEFADSPGQSGGPGSELRYLSEQLGMPSIDELVQSVLAETSEALPLQKLVRCWVDIWVVDCKTAETMQSRGEVAVSRRWQPKPLNLTHYLIPSFLHTGPELLVSHPLPYSLVALPATHDMLNAEAMSRKCPTTGGELDDPSICLFCGAFVCSQARCCRRQNRITQTDEGGCLMHREICGGNVGMFLNIRKCAVLMLHHRNGSWFPAPYLDRYGETDLGLRRKEQLFLNKKRYDKLYRDVWLSNGIPTAVARKLEAEINTGGWEGL